MNDYQKNWDDSLISMGLGALVVVVSGVLLFNYFTNQSVVQRKIAESQITVNQSSSNQKDTKAVVSETVKPTASSLVVVSPTSTPALATSATPHPTASVVPTPTPTSTTAQAVTTTTGLTAISTASLYTVQRGESLSSISKRVYGSTDQWKQLADANNISGRYVIYTGTILQVPRTAVISAAATTIPSTSTISPVTASTSPTATVLPVSQGPSSVQPLIQTNQPLQVTYTIVRGDSLWTIASKQCNNAYLYTSIARQNRLVTPRIVHAGNTLTFVCK